MIGTHLPHVMEIEKQSFGTPWSEADLLSMLRERATIGKVAARDGEIVGFYIYTLHENFIEVNNLAVRESERNSGVGRAIVEDLKEKAATRGALRMRLRSDLPKAHAFAEHIGFTRADTIENHYKDGSSAIDFYLGQTSPQTAAPIPEDKVFELANGRFRFGGEMEARRAAMAALVRHYQVDIDRSVLLEGAFENYVHDSANVAALPEKIRKQLTEGLPVGKAKEQLGVDASKWELQLPDWVKGGNLIIPGAGARPPSGILLPEKREAAPAPTWRAPRPAPFRPEPKAIEWSATAVQGEIERRWKAVPLEVKREAIDPHRLDPALLAEMIYFGEAKITGFRETTTPANRALLSDYVMAKQRTWMEYNHDEAKVFDRPEDYLKSIEGLFSLAQVSSQLNDPVRPRQSANAASYHAHVSAKDGRNLRQFAESYNRLLLMRAVALGYGPQVLEMPSHVSWKSNIADKGLVRLVEHNRIELRDHYKSPREELREVLGLLLLPQAAAITKMSNEVQDLLTDENRRYLERVAPDALAYASKSYSTASNDHRRKWTRDYASPQSLCQEIAIKLPH